MTKVENRAHGDWVFREGFMEENDVDLTLEERLRL